MTNASFWLVPMAAALLVSPVPVRADRTDTSTMEHPVTAYHEHEVASDQKELTVTSEEMNAKKHLRDQAKKNYEDSLSKLGADSPATKDAKSQYTSAQNDYMKLVKK